MATSVGRRPPSEVSFIHEISVQEASARELTLPYVPESEVYFHPLDGVPQAPAGNFVVDGVRLSWANLGLEETLVRGDRVHIKYLAFV